MTNQHGHIHAVLKMAWVPLAAVCICGCAAGGEPRRTVAEAREKLTGHYDAITTPLHSLNRAFAVSNPAWGTLRSGRELLPEEGWEFPLRDLLRSAEASPDQKLQAGAVLVHYRCDTDVALVAEQLRMLLKREDIDGYQARMAAQILRYLCIYAPAERADLIEDGVERLWNMEKADIEEVWEQRVAEYVKDRQDDTQPWQRGSDVSAVEVLARPLRGGYDVSRCTPQTGTLTMGIIRLGLHPAAGSRKLIETIHADAGQIARHMRGPLQGLLKEKYGDEVRLLREFVLKREMLGSEERQKAGGLLNLCPVLMRCAVTELAAEQVGDPMRFTASQGRSIKLMEEKWLRVNEETEKKPQRVPPTRDDIEKSYPGLWASTPDLAQVIFACEAAEGLQEGRKLLSVLLDLCQDSDDYWVRACARRLAIQLIDLDGSGVKNYRTDIYQLPGAKHGYKRLLWHAYGNEKSTLWFPYRGEKELEAILEVYRLRLTGTSYVDMPPIMTSGRSAAGELTDQEITQEIARAQRLLKERNEDWREMRERIRLRRPTSVELMTHVEMTFLHSLRKPYPEDGRLYFDVPTQIEHW